MQTCEQVLVPYYLYSTRDYQMRGRPAPPFEIVVTGAYVPPLCVVSGPAVVDACGEIGLSTTTAAVVTSGLVMVVVLL